MHRKRENYGVARLGLERLRLHARKMALEMRMPATTAFLWQLPREGHSLGQTDKLDHICPLLLTDQQLLFFFFFLMWFRFQAYFRFSSVWQHNLRVQPRDSLCALIIVTRGMYFLFFQTNSWIKKRKEGNVKILF
jgi:hypothetical protein